MAQINEETLGSKNWTPKIVADRLHNALSARNRALKLEAAAAAAAEAAAAEAPEEEEVRDP